MTVRKDLVIAVSVTFCLTVALFTIIPINSQSVGDYDHWLDINDDGTIDMKDVASVARAYGTDGTAVNKTQLLLDLQGKIDSLNQTMETRMPMKGYVSVPAAAFDSQYNDDLIDRSGSEICNNHTSFYISLYAAVQLPHGALITNFTSHWYDDDADQILCSLRGCENGIDYVMANAHSTGSSGLGSTHATTIGFATVDNAQRGYYIFVHIPPSLTTDSYRFYEVIIEYQYSA